MKFSKSRWLVSTLSGSTSCTLGATPAPTEDVGAIQTQAYSIVLTQVAMHRPKQRLQFPLPCQQNPPLRPAFPDTGSTPHLRL